MDRLSELKEKQQEIGDKISLLRETNKKKDEEANEIRKLIAECRENLNRIKNIAPGTEPVLLPCPELDGLGNIDGEFEKHTPSSRAQRQVENLRNENEPCPEINLRNESGALENTLNTASATLGSGEPKRKPCAPSKLINGKRAFHFEETNKDYKGKHPCQTEKKKIKCPNKNKVSCKVDLNKMKVKLRGPSEDLRKLDATQLINLLEKYKCQELTINTEETIVQDTKEIRLVYFWHPGNIVMAAGVAMIAYLINANLCGTERTVKTKFLLNALYLSSIAIHYGFALWMSFIRGYALRFGLSFDNFHLVDNLLLPKYFTMCVLLSAVSLYSFLATHCSTSSISWPLQAFIQMIITAVTFFMELITICYIVPALIKLRDATDDCPWEDDESEQFIPENYEKNLIKLGKLNWTLCLINLLTIIFLSANIYYITTKLNLGSSV